MYEYFCCILGLYNGVILQYNLDTLGLIFIVFSLLMSFSF